MEFKYFSGPWWQRWVRLDAAAASQDLLKALHEYYGLINGPPLKLFSESDTLREKQLEEGCVLTSTQIALSPGDGGQNGIPIKAMLRWQISQIHSQFASGVLWEADFLYCVKIASCAEETGLFSFGDVREFLWQATGNRLSFRRVENPQKVLPLQKQDNPLVRSVLLRSFCVMRLKFSPSKFSPSFQKIAKCGRYIVCGISGRKKKANCKKASRRESHELELSPPAKKARSSSSSSSSQAPAIAVLPGPWACAFCTFINESNHSVCKICRNLKNERAS